MSDLTCDVITFYVKLQYRYNQRIW